MGLAGEKDRLDLAGRRDRQRFKAKLPNLLMKHTKQVIVIRKDLNMRKGKIAAQAAHACMAFLTSNGRTIKNDMDDAFMDSFRTTFRDHHTEEIQHWLDHSFRKICVYVESEEELLKVYSDAANAGLIHHLITDNGTTEFNGVPTHTCIALGPNWDHRFEGITSHLPLY